MIARIRPRSDKLAFTLRREVEARCYVPRYVLSDAIYELGTVLEKWERFSLTDAQISVHMAVMGGSGSGKSKFIELLLRQRLIEGRPFGLWDPHGDLVNSLIAFVAALKAHGNDSLWRKVHVLELSPDTIFAFDPVARLPLRSVVGEYAYYQALKTRIDQLIKVVLRNISEANQDVMVRLKRWLRCILYACLVAIDDNNTHLGLDKALIFTDPSDPEFMVYFAKVERHLPPRVRRNFEKLMGTKRAQDQEKWVESTINKLEEALSPLTALVYSQARPSIDIKGIIDRGEFLLINLKETEYFSSEEKRCLGGLLLSEVLAAKKSEENVPEDERKEFMICVDEVGELLGEDLKMALGATRKWRCPILIGGQDLSTLTRGDLDMAAKVLTMCGTVACFQNTFLEDKRILADRVFCGNLDLFTKRMVEVQRQRGDRILRYDEISESHGRTENWSNTISHTDTETHAKQIANALALSSTRSETKNESTGTSTKGRIGNEIRTENTTTGSTTGSGRTSTQSNAHTDTSGHSDSAASMEGGGRSASITVAHKIVVQPNIVSEFEEDGTLQEGTPELQRARKEQVIHTLGIGQAAIAVRGVREALVIQVDPVEEWFTDGKLKHEAIRRMKARLFDLHPYYFTPPKLVDKIRVAIATSHHRNGNGELNGHANACAPLA